MRQTGGSWRRRFLPCYFLALLCIPLTASSQRKITSSLLAPQISSYSAPLPEDSLILKSGKVKLVDEDRSKSTTLAMLLSAALPGMGQIYAERYWTIPIIWGLGYTFGKSYLKGADLYKDYQEQFTRSVEADTASHLGNDRLRELRDFYRDERDRFAIYLALTYVLNIIDAYVGASLYSFDVSDNLGGATAKIRIPVR